MREGSCEKKQDKCLISFYPDSSSSLEEVDSEIPDAMEKKNDKTDIQRISFSFKSQGCKVTNSLINENNPLTLDSKIFSQ